VFSESVGGWELRVPGGGIPSYWLPHVVERPGGRRRGGSCNTSSRDQRCGWELRVPGGGIPSYWLPHVVERPGATSVSGAPAVMSNVTPASRTGGGEPTYVFSLEWRAEMAIY
jgi:hypothetical protein